MDPLPDGVAGLFRLGHPDASDDWPDYVGLLSLGPEHVPELLRVVGDPQLYTEHATDMDFWATVHARRALGQLGDPSAVRPLLDAMDRYGDFDDYWSDEIPAILAKVGPAAIPEIVGKLEDESANEYTRMTCVSALEQIAEEAPETREEVVAALIRQLSRNDPRVPALNGDLISGLSWMKVAEAVPAMERAFEAGVVDETVTGGWEWVQYDMGLIPHRPKGPRYDLGFPPSFYLDADVVHRKSRPDVQKLKKQHKAQRQARKRNRKRR